MQRLFLKAERKSIIVKIPIHASVALLLAAGVLAGGNTFAGPQLAGPQRLECTLTDTDAQSAVEHRSIAIIFDEDAATMQLREGGRSRNLSDVSISMTSMSGGEADMTIGVSRSSWRVVLQTYQKNSVRTEYGVCALSGQQPPTAPATP